MKKIYKYLMPGQVMSLHCAKVLLVAHDRRDMASSPVPTLWVEVDEDCADIWHFTILGTGHEVPDHVGEHIGSCQCDEFVWHVYGKKT